jgi:mitogen-activated protein kinase 1/3
MSRYRAQPHKYFFNVGEKYDILKVVHEGACAVVCSALHNPTGAKVAIKRITPSDQAFLWLRALRETLWLRHFDHENIISFLGVHRPITYEEFGEVYLTQELMDTNMHRVIETQELSDDHCQYFIYQILRALKAIHSAGVLHRDLKPSSLLLNGNCDLKVCSFGIARPAAGIENDQALEAEYVGMRWYRAPELMLTPKNQTMAIDMWSAGCILAEILGGKPLFPGKDYDHQLILILDTLGTPLTDDRNAIKSKRARQYIDNLSLKPKIPWKETFPKASDLALDMLERLLAFNPIKRISVEEALKHPYLKLYHDPADEPIAAPIPKDLLDFDKKAGKLSSEELRSKIFPQYDLQRRMENQLAPGMMYETTR